MGAGCRGEDGEVLLEPPAGMEPGQIGRKEGLNVDKKERIFFFTVAQ
jgi:hypothetical protein